MAASPVVRRSLPPTHRERVVPPSVDQVLALADAMPARSRAMVITQAGLGLRLGDLLSLRCRTSTSCVARCGWEGRSRREPECAAYRRPGVRPGRAPPPVAALSRHVAEFTPGEDGTLR